VKHLQIILSILDVYRLKTIKTEFVLIENVYYELETVAVTSSKHYSVNSSDCGGSGDAVATVTAASSTNTVFMY
jgi:hypothetical protein